MPKPARSQASPTLEEVAKELIVLVADDMDRAKATGFNFDGTFQHAKTGKSFRVEFHVSKV